MEIESFQGFCEGNVDSSYQARVGKWAQSVEKPIGILHQQAYTKRWRTQILHKATKVAHVDHIVLDLNWNPCPLVDQRS